MKACILLLVMAVLSTPFYGFAAEAGGGADLPWFTHEAEEAKTTGSVLGPDFTGNTAAREASARRCVRLTANGDSVSFTAKADAQGLIVRYSIPDSADGKGADATLSLYINNKLQNKLQMTSRYTYLYGEYPFNNEPKSGTPRNFWDELRVVTGSIRSGDEIRLQKDADDTASQYMIDFIDLEPIPTALAKPGNAISVTEFGATPNDATDDRPAFLAAIQAAKLQGKEVWIPPGRFVIKGSVEVSDIAVHGAGMWYSTLVGVDDYTPENRITIQGSGSNITLSDFAIIGKLNYRNDSEPNDGIGGSFGTGSSVRNIWVEHTKAGAWLVNSDGLQIEGCRFRNNIADGINLCVGMRNTVVRNCTARGTGDDCFAMWPATYAKATYDAGFNRYVNCTAQLPFLAQAFSIYGGEGNTVENCNAIDIPYGAGLFASTTFPTESGFRGITTFKKIHLLRTGDSNGAIGTVANLKDLAGLRFEDVDVVDSATDAVRFISLNERVLRDMSLDRIRIVNAGLSGVGGGVVAAPKAVGSAKLSNVTVVNAKSAGWQNNSSKFEMIRGDGNSDSAEKPEVDRESPRAVVQP